MKVTGGWIDAPETQVVCRLLTEAGHRALFVGGCVRNALLGAPVSDIDISTDARPTRVMDLAQSAGLNVVPTGIDHGTVTVVSGGIPHEITTFRRDIETDGRRAVVAFADTIEEDARRRDFTMNALYGEADGTVIDPLNGLPDLRARRVKFIENPEARIREDYLRILRFFRFHAWYGDPAGGLDVDGLAACATLSAGLGTLSKERIGAELLKLLSAPDPAPSMAAMVQAGCLTPILPGADATALPILVHLEKVANQTPDAIRRLAALGGQDHAKLLRLSRKQAKRLAILQDSAHTLMPPHEAAYRHGSELAQDIALVSAALMETPLPEDLDARIARGAKARFPIGAADLPSNLTGAEIGKALTHLETQWIGSDFKNSKSDLLRDL